AALPDPLHDQPADPDPEGRWADHREADKLYSGDYDARGNPGYTHARSVSEQHIEGRRLTRDRAERVTEVKEQSGLERVLKSFTYADSNAGADKRKGKLVSAVRNTYGSSATTTIETNDEYLGVGGRVSQRDTFVDGNTRLRQTATWHETGRLASLGYPTCVSGGCVSAGEPSRTVAYSYDNDFLTAVAGYASSITYHPNGMVSGINHANGVTDLWTADPYGMRRPARITTSPTSIYTFDTGAYAYDSAGNIKAMGQDSFAYDEVNRLVSATVGGKPFVYSYDTFGNRLDTESGPLEIDQGTNRYTMNGGWDDEIYYDPWGRLTGWEKATSYHDYDYREVYDYDPLGMVTRHEAHSGHIENRHDPPSLTPLDLAETFAYDASDDRIRHERRVPVAGGADDVEVTWRLRDLGGAVVREFKEVDTDVPPDGVVDEWQWSKDTVWRDGTLLAARKASEGFDRHYHTDHLGSLRLVTGSGATGVTAFRLGPFGEEISSGNEETRFTGHERDVAGMGNFGDLDYMHARYYSPVMGRFISPDPIESGKVGVPQSWNKYAYARNNPLRFVDRDGREPITFTVVAVAAGAGALEGAAFQVAINAISGEPLGQGVLREAGIGAGLGATGAGLIQVGRKGFQAVRAAQLARAIRAGRIIRGPAGTVSRAALESAAQSGGAAVRVVTRLDSAPAAGRALSTATGQGAEALANAARGGGTLFEANIPKALLNQLEEAGLVVERLTELNGVVGKEIRFLPEATEFIEKFFRAVE
ncbi:MAG: RHS repeat-associated core domain-containing protein, partial [Thermoanaerobaculia bacterium]